MFAKRNNEEEDYSYYWQLTNDWREDKRYNENGETADTKRRKVRRGDGNVAAENRGVPPAASPHHTESAAETISRLGQTRDSETDHPTKKREIMRENNKFASRKCRQMKKEYVKGLEERVAALENQNKTLIEEVGALKGFFCVKTE
ncbi:cyclic AMP-dependent transcription factor ATF-1-like [Genypterus blacodes]|uniref:cyclic AMP-dependent transcription factor ATF-1-like n=1 Tax=Genypterus blacodes TaxID=154954 RepID=UPI003F76B495